MRVLLGGGGLDSTAVTIIEQDRLDAVFHIDYGQLPAQAERSATYRVLRALRRTKLYQGGTFHARWMRALNPDNMLFVRGGSESFVIGRNLALLQEAAGWFLSTKPDEQLELVLGLCYEAMMFSDADAQFVRDVDALFARCYGSLPNGEPRVRVIAPYINVSKRDFLQLAIDCLSARGQDINLLWDKSFTCWTPTVKDTECGECYHCEKKQTLRAALQKEPAL